jgi:Rps23 Pro-64 3,4-dihydroxylase Tpa1-like proline 4-hydroxylase
VDQLEEIVGHKNVFADYSLHGGGIHSHGPTGKLNMHKDYYIHPKISLKRNYNIIVYMTPDWQPSWGGGLQLWSHNSKTDRPLACESKYDIKFNRAILFNTTQNSWHGLPDPIACPEGLARRSLACYYLTKITNEDEVEYRYRAKFVPNADQENDLSVKEFCDKRSKF